VIELRYGKNEQLKRIAQEIIVDQMQEIAAMRLAIGERVSTISPVPTQSLPHRRRQPSPGYADGYVHWNEEVGATMKTQLSKSRALACTILARPVRRNAARPRRGLRPDIAISHHDRVYAASSFPTRSGDRSRRQQAIGVIRLGDPQPQFQPALQGQFSSTAWAIRRITARFVVSIGSNSVTFIDTATNASST